jgi:hypothetical protein
MLIGEDFEKIAVSLFDLQLFEPNALIGDMLIFIQALYYYYYQIKKTENKTLFFHYWKIAFMLFGISFLLGGLGHFFFHYFGVFGKSFSWFGGIISVFFIEKALISIHPDKSKKQILYKFILLKLVVGCLLELVVLCSFDLSQKQSIGLIIPSICSAIGLVYTLGYLGWKYSRIIASSFQYFYMSTFLLLPNLFIQGCKINISPYFDRNDFSHLLLLLSSWCYYKAIKDYERNILLKHFHPTL